MFHRVVNTNHPDAAVFRQQMRQRAFVRQQQIAQPLLVAGKFKGHLGQIHVAEIRPVRRVNRRIGVKRQPFRQIAPAHHCIAGLTFFPQDQTQRF